MENLNELYTQTRIGNFTDDVSAHLAHQIHIPNSENPKLHVSEADISFSAFEKDELNTVQKTLILLVIANSPYDDYLLEDMNVVILPSHPIYRLKDNDQGEIFGNYIVNAKVYCLYQAYTLLASKLGKRNTSLFRILFICTCLGLWEKKVPSEVILWPNTEKIHWENMIETLCGNFSEESMIDFGENGYGKIIEELKIHFNKKITEEVPENIMNELYKQMGIIETPKFPNASEIIQGIIDSTTNQ